MDNNYINLTEFTIKEREIPSLDYFLKEYQNGNFDSEGLRKVPYKQFLLDYQKKEGLTNG